MSEYRIGHLEVESPFGNAGGVVKHVEDVERMAHTGVGWIEAGSYTLEPRDGNGANGEVVYYHNPETKETFNSLGMPNKGMDVVEEEIPEMAKVAHGHNKPLIINVAPVTDDPAPESVELVRRAYEAGADAVLLNAGCPNVVTGDGGRHELLSRSWGGMFAVAEALRPVAGSHAKLFIRISPQETLADCKVINGYLESSEAFSAVFTPNTWPGQRPLDENDKPILEVPGGAGGLSGPATFEDSRLQTFEMVRNSTLDIVSSSAIVDGAELAYRMQTIKVRRHIKDVARAAVAGAGTTFFYESGDWEHDVDKFLWQFQDAQPSGSS